MNAPQLYRGVWPQNVDRLAKYAVRLVDGDWKVTVWCATEEGPRYLAVQGASADLADRVNAIKTAVHSQLGGAFYVNEYRHILVPVNDSASSGAASLYYYAGRLEDDLLFEFEGELLTGKPERPDGTRLNNGEHWVGPRPGIPYVLSAGGADICYETPALSDDHPPTVRPSVTDRVLLSEVLPNKCIASEASQGEIRTRAPRGALLRERIRRHVYPGRRGRRERPGLRLLRPDRWKSVVPRTDAGRLAKDPGRP